jgi:cellulose synthase/poly-beta-1,6-N-acetylglucosamine synthase-like glycosyltransferase
VACLQAALQYWNEHDSVITRFYRAEYTVHFKWILPGLAKLGLIEPLGGTSNHFRTQVVRDIGGWDPYNVTEDADMAGALAIAGYQVRSFDSWTDEEASKRLRSADKQRRRWLMGYTVTGLAYTRRPIKQARQMGVKRWFFFNLFMLGTPFCLIINPLFWGMTIAYFITGSPIIQHLWPAPLYIAGIILMVIGDLLLFYQMVFACVKQEGYRSVKYMLLLPFWWAFSSYSAYMMLYELVRHPHRWNKTTHEGRAYDAQEEEIAQAMIA